MVYCYSFNLFFNSYKCTKRLTGPSKKLAKNAAAKVKFLFKLLYFRNVEPNFILFFLQAALATLCDISYSPMQSLPTSDAIASSDKKESYELPQTFADAIGK